MEYWGNVSYFATASSLDPDVATYIANVAAADGQSLEAAVIAALNDFVATTKSDGSYAALTDLGNLGIARTATGNLIPLKGTVTNVGFPSSSYARKGGFLGDGASYLRLGTTLTSLPQNSISMGCNVVAVNTNQASYPGLMGATGTTIYTYQSDTNMYFENRSRTVALANQWNATGFVGMTRSLSTLFTATAGGVTGQSTVASAASSNIPIAVYARATGATTANIWGSGGRQTCYFVGANIDIPLFRTRMNTFVAAVAAAIP